jgi:EamA domain-containing membrane protein RarD
VLAYGEPFTHVQLIAFGCIWTALIIYSVDTALHARPAPQPAATPTVE